MDIQPLGSVCCKGGTEGVSHSGGVGCVDPDHGGLPGSEEDMDIYLRGMKYEIQECTERKSVDTARYYLQGG